MYETKLHIKGREVHYTIFSPHTCGRTASRIHITSVCLLYASLYSLCTTNEITEHVIPPTIANGFSLRNVLVCFGEQLTFL